MRGDIVLYKAGESWRERLVAWVTHGDYVHVAIQVSQAPEGSAQTVIQAMPSGIEYDRLEGDYDIIAMRDYADEEHIKAGVDWAMEQFGKEYGWLDIVYQGVKFLFPNNPLQLVWKDHWDCSNYTVRYIQQCGVMLPDTFADPYSDTPNDIGRLFGLIKMRPGINVEPIKPLEEAR